MTKVEESGKRTKRGGRTKGTPNKTTALLKDAILQSAQNAGGDEGLVGYIEHQANAHPAAFMTLLGKVLPMQVEGPGEGGAFPVALTVKFE